MCQTEEVHPAGSIAIKPAHDPADHRLHCISCGYDLHTIDLASKCPECGCEASESVGVPHMSKSWRFGFLLLALWVPIFWVPYLFGFYLMYTQSAIFPSLFWIYPIVDWASNLHLVVGFWLILQPSVGGRITLWSESYRSKAKVTFWIWAGIQILQILTGIAWYLTGIQFRFEGQYHLEEILDSALLAVLFSYLAMYAAVFGRTVGWSRLANLTSQIAIVGVMLFAFQSIQKLAMWIAEFWAQDYYNQLMAGGSADEPLLLTIIRFLGIGLWVFWYAYVLVMTIVAFYWWRKAPRLIPTT